jgi:hypothetical protein
MTVVPSARVARRCLGKRPCGWGDALARPPSWSCARVRAQRAPSRAITISSARPAENALERRPPARTQDSRRLLRGSSRRGLEAMCPVRLLEEPVQEHGDRDQRSLDDAKIKRPHASGAPTAPRLDLCTTACARWLASEREQHRESVVIPEEPERRRMRTWIDSWPGGAMGSRTTPRQVRPSPPAP